MTLAPRVRFFSSGIRPAVAKTIPRREDEFSPTSKEFAMADAWLSSLITDTPQAGFELAIKLSRMGVKYTQPSAEARDKLRPVYAEDANALIASSQVVAINFQTIAAANGYWRG